MQPSYLQADRGDRAKAAGAVLIIHLLLGATLLTGLARHIDRRPGSILTTFDVPPPPPPPLTEERHVERFKATPTPAGRVASPTPIVAPPAKIPVRQPVNAAPIAGTGSAANAGAASAGAGTGAGGSGNGVGGGGTADGRIGALLISGRLSNRDYRTIAGGEIPQGSGVYVLLVNPSGRVERCRPAASSGSTRIDQSFCAILTQRLIFRPAMESDGRPLYQDVNYVARWGR